jgi:hypothetical protein
MCRHDNFNLRTAVQEKTRLINRGSGKTGRLTGL